MRTLYQRPINPLDLLSIPFPHSFTQSPQIVLLIMKKDVPIHLSHWQSAALTLFYAVVPIHLLASC